MFGTSFGLAFTLGNWIPRIPDVKDGYGLSGSGVGVLLLMLALGTLIAFLVFAGRSRKIGIPRMATIAGPLWPLLLFTAFAMPTPWAMAPVLVCCGLMIGALEIALNTSADDLEVRSGRRLMSQTHGFWSIGSLLGALVGAGIAQLGYRLVVHGLLVLLPTAAFALAAGLALRGLPARPHTDGGGQAARFGLPSMAILGVAVLPVGMFVIEGTFIDWSALFARERLGAGPLQAGLVFACFGTSMAVMRLLGDGLTERLGRLAMVRLSTVTATVGVLLFVAAPNLVTAYAAAFLAGLGVATVYPIAMSAAAERPGSSVEHVTAMSLVSFTAFMAMPPLIGLLTDAFGLRGALAFAVPVAATSILLAGQVAPKGTRT